MPTPMSWVRASDLRVVLSLVLGKQLEISRHEEDEARLWAFIVAEDRERVMVAGIR